jgi:hypothetical protein
VLSRNWLRAVPLTALLLAGALAATSGPARAAGAGPAAPAPGAAGSTSTTVHPATTEQIRAMAANGSGRLDTLGGAPGGPAAASATSVTCYLDIGLPYGGGPYNSHVYVDGDVYCDDYVHLGVLTVELYRDASRAAYSTVTFAYVPGALATAASSTCISGVYFGVVGATLSRYDLTPQTISATQIGYPLLISCGPPPPPPPPPPVPFAVTNPGNRSSLDGNPERLQMTATGGTAPYTWSAANLPTGLSINAGTGLITGAATRTGNWPVTVTATDAAHASASTQFSWLVRHDGCPHC